MVKLFQILAAILTGVAAFFLWQGNYDGVFLFAVLSSVSYFLSFRFQVKERLDKREEERLEREFEEMEMNRNLLKENRSLFDIDQQETPRSREKISNDN